MTISREPAGCLAAGGREWEAIVGNHVTLYVLPGTPEAEHAPEELREADLLLVALKKLLTPDDALVRESISLYLADAHSSLPNLPASMLLKEADCVVEEQEIRRTPLPRALRLPPHMQSLCLLLTEHVVRQWFGVEAASAGLFIEGIAGVAAAQAGIGPAIEEADRRVRAELEADRPVSVAAKRRSHAEEGNRSADPLDPIAISFVGFLISNADPSALNRYLSAYDSNRTDLAAITAYHQPLAVLEEEWISKLRHHPDNGVLLRNFVRQIFPLLKPYKWKQVEILVYLVLAAAYTMVQPYAIKIFIDRLSQQVHLKTGIAGAEGLFLQMIAPFLALLIGINVLNAVVSLRRAYTVNWLNQNVLNTLQIQMFAHLQRLGHNFYLKAKIGDIMVRLNDDLDNVQSALSQITNKALYQGFTIVGALTALFLLTRKSPILAVPILCIIPLFAVYYAALRTRNKQASREQRRRVGQAMADVQQRLSAHALIKAFGMEERAISDYRSRVLALQKSKLRLAVLSALTDLSEDATTVLAQLIIFGMGGYLVLRNGGKGLGVGDLTALLVLVKSIFSPIASLAGIGQTIQQATGSLERVSELFNEPVTVCDKASAENLPLLAHEIRMQNITFRYGGKRPALRDVSLTIPAGKYVAIVGLSGSGKSSLVNLLMRFWDPEEGAVLFDGHDLREVTLASLRSQIGLVFQETFIFNTTLRENIALARPGATDAEIVAAAKAAQLDSFIQSLPAGYDSIPGENGASLSVGQKQRIAIARVFLRNPRILILDEATSALDAQTEAGVLEILMDLARSRTTISITHRIAQASSADLIYVMDSGRLVQQGTHESLMRSGGLYRRLYEEATGFVTHDRPAEIVASAT